MVTGWRRAFCTSIPKDHEPKIAIDKNGTTTTTTTTTVKTPRFGAKFNFFSSSTSSSQPSTPRSQSQTPLASNSPTLSCRTTTTTTTTTETRTPTRLQCKTSSSSTPTKSPRLFLQTRTSSTTPSSPRSPSAFSLLKNSLRLTKTSTTTTTATTSTCGICLLNVKSGQGTAIFTAECSHSFHFPCITKPLTTCPVCGSHWKEVPLLSVPVKKSSQPSDQHRMYDDDEPLMSPVSGIRFNPIPESEEENTDMDMDMDTDTDFPGFFSDPTTPRYAPHQFVNYKGVEVSLSPQSAVVAVGRTYETYAVLLTVRAPPAPQGSRRSSVDLVVVLDVGASMMSSKLHVMKRSMRTLISSLSSNDRLSIVAYSSSSKRLLPLRRMTPSGRRSARRIIDALNFSHGSCVNDALRKAAKVLQDRKEKNHFASIVLLDGNQEGRFEVVSSTRFSHLEIPIHTFNLCDELLPYEEETFVKSVNELLSVVVLDLRFQLNLKSSGSEIAAVYSCTGRPGLLSTGLAKLGDMYSSEEREILVELKVPAAVIGCNHVLSVRCFHKDPSTKQMIYGRDHPMVVPRPHTIRSCDPTIGRLRSLFVMTRAVAESRRLLAERNDLAGAERLLASAKAVLSQPSFKVVTAAEEFRRRVEAELAEVRWRRQEREKARRKEKENGANGGVGVGVGGGGGCCLVDEKGEPLTPTSAWKAAERLAKVAIMRKSLNRVSDLHGFEDARF